MKNTDLRDALLAIRDRHGFLDPDVVVEEARDENHPLHNRFEWDDSVAAQAYRREQAHKLIQVVRVPFEAKAGPRDVRAFLAVPRTDSKQPVYEPVEELMQDDVARKVVLAQMHREWRALQARYGELVEFGEMVRSSAAAESSQVAS